MVEAVSIKLKATIEEIVKQAVSKIEDGILQKFRREFSDEVEKLNVKALSETELLESYNRRENVRITGVAEKTFTTHDGKLIAERTETTMKTVLDISTCLEAGLQLSDISIAHRLPSRFSSSAKPIVVRFSRRVAKIELLRRKKDLKSIPELSHIRISEDITKARLNFLQMIRQDQRIDSCWTKEGTLYYVWKENHMIYKINGLYQGAIDLQYSFNDVKSCFGEVAAFLPPLN